MSGLERRTAEELIRDAKLGSSVPTGHHLDRPGTFPVSRLLGNRPMGARFRHSSGRHRLGSVPPALAVADESKPRP